MDEHILAFIRPFVRMHARMQLLLSSIAHCMYSVHQVRPQPGSMNCVHGTHRERYLDSHRLVCHPLGGSD